MLRLAATLALIPTIALVPGPLRAERTADAVLDAVVAVTAEVPDDARTTEMLGDVRSGNGVAIDDAGLVLTIGYLILEATAITLETRSGREIPAETVAYDHETGLGLVRALGPLEVEPLVMGSSAELGEGAYALVVPHGGAGVSAVRVVGRRDFAGYWEYLLEDAIYTAPVTRDFAGAPLVDERRELVGIGSLAVAEAAEPGTYMPGNLFVPVDALKPALADLLESGRRAKPHRPWLGLYCEAAGDTVGIADIVPEGPAATAGLREGDRIVAVDGTPVESLAGFYRKLWSLGGPGTEVPLTVRRAGEYLDLRVTAGDRYEWLKLERTY